MKRKPNLSFILTMLSTLVVAAAVMFTIPGSAQAATSSGQKVVKLTVDRPTDVGGATLQPGKYSVKIMQSSENSSDPTLQLSHTIYDPYVEEGLSPYGEEVVVTVSATTQDLGAPAASTELTVSSAGDNRARGLEIRGNNIEYVFETTATAGANGQ